jgi:nucleotide-binding universal stress UspA family protein
VNLAHEVEPWHLKHPAVPVKRALVGGAPLEGLRRVSHAAAMLVVGTAGGSHSPLGSVSHGLIESASCPVAIVRS